MQRVNPNGHCRRLKGAARAFRSNTGAVFGTMLNLTLIPVVVWICVCIVELGLIGSYQLRLQFICQQAANCAVNIPADEKMDFYAKKVTALLLEQNGLTAHNLAVHAREDVVNHCEAITVTAKGDFPLLWRSAAVQCPVKVLLTASATKTMALNRVCGEVAISPMHCGEQQVEPAASLYIPIIRPKFDNTVWEFACGEAGAAPIPGLPYDVTLHDLHLVDGTLPALPTSVDNELLADRPSLY